MTDIPAYGVLLIFLLPLLSFCIIAFIIRPFLNHKPLYAGYVTIGSLGVSLTLALWTLISVNHSGAIESGPTEWIKIGGTTITLGLMILGLEKENPQQISREF